MRNSLPLFGLGLIDAIPDAVLRAAAVAAGTRGRLHIVRDALGNERIKTFILAFKINGQRFETCNTLSKRMGVRTGTSERSSDGAVKVGWVN